MARTFHPVRTGERVTPGVTNRYPDEILSLLQSVQSQLAATADGSALYVRDSPLEPSLLVGSPVYYNPANHRFEGALVRVDSSAENLSLLTLDSSRPKGVVIRKTAADVGDVALAGVVTNVDVSPAAGVASAPVGLYYVSTTTAGRITASRPALAVPILEILEPGAFYVLPQWKDAVDEHTHYRYELKCFPAGAASPPTPGNRHVIDDADAGVEGWLPADHAVFGGTAPEGAQFGYNFSMAPRLRNTWPPIPIGSACLEWDRAGDDDAGAVSVSLGEPHRAVIDNNGIWWMTDCYNEVPWPLTYDSGVETSDDYVDGSTDSECPFTKTMRMHVWFTKPTFFTQTSVVTSIQPAEGSPLRFRCAGTTTDAIRGDLEADVDFAFLEGDDDAEGHIVFKAIAGNTFQRGPVVSGLRAGSSGNLILTSDQDADGLYQGHVTIDVSSALALRDLDVHLVKLESVSETYPFEVPALGFRAGYDSRYLAKITIPTAGLPASPYVRFRVRLLGATAGTLPTLELTYKKVSAPSPINTPTTLSAGFTALDWATPSPEVAVLANQYIDARSEPISVTAGDVVVFSLQRNGAAGDGYAGLIHALWHAATLQSGA